ncbi:MAG: helix-turn-helix domain-containing protein [archaeon GB-1845-036]|nr:helix-turn-helix domain-containing protein [Candidatus Culexmicrobium thermophilum]
MAEKRREYVIKLVPEERRVDVIFTGSYMNFRNVKLALLEIKEYIGKGYRVKLKGYSHRHSSDLDAFFFALKIVGYEDKIVFEEKARYSRSKRKAMMNRAIDLWERGIPVKRISEELNIPLKTVYRWISKRRK